MTSVHGCARERQLDRGDHAVGAVRVDHREDVAPAQLEHARRRRLGRHHAQPEHRAVLRQPAVEERAVPRRAAADEAADGGGAPRRRVLAELPAVAARRVLDVAELGAGAGADGARLGVDVLDRVEGAHVEHRAAAQRHRLPVVAGAGAARRERHAVLHRGGARGEHVRLARREHERVGHHALERRLQDGTVPVEVAAPPRHLAARVVVVGRDEHVHAGGAQLGDEGLDRRRFDARAVRRAAVRKPPARGRRCDAAPRRPAWHGTRPGLDRGKALDLDDKLGPRKAAHDHQRRRRRRQRAERRVARPHVPRQVLARGHVRVEPHDVLQPSALSGEDCGYVLERESRLRFGAVGDRAVLGDAELPAARDQPGVRRHDAPVRVPRKRRVGVDGFGRDGSVHGGLGVKAGEQADGEEAWHPSDVHR